MGPAVCLSLLSWSLKDPGQVLSPKDQLGSPLSPFPGKASLISFPNTTDQSTASLEQPSAAPRHLQIEASIAGQTLALLPLFYLLEDP